MLLVIDGEVFSPSDVDVTGATPHVRIIGVLGRRRIDLPGPCVEVRIAA
jgi:hypothetical protein